MAKNVYHLITDSHFDYQGKNNRVDYLGEIDLVKSIIMERVLYTNSLGFNSYVVFLGDVYNHGFKDVESAMAEIDFMALLNSITKGVFSVIGNHELHFPKGNPFWSLLSEIPEGMTNLPTNNLKLKGAAGLLQITDRLVDGNVVFNFNHYGSGILKPIPNKVNIGLFHQDIVCSPAINSAKMKGLNPYESKAILLDSNDVLVGYDYSYFGHFHKYYGKWEIDNGRFIHYLGSLVRTNVTEVNDNFLERTLPCVYVEEGKLIKIEDYKFNLPNEQQCVKIDVVEKERKRRKVKKEIIDVKKKELITEDVISSVKLALEKPIYAEIIDSVLENRKNLLDIELERIDSSEG